MKVEVLAMLRLPNSNEYISKGEILEVIDIMGAYYLCSYKGFNVAIYKGNLKEIKENGIKKYN